MGLLSGVTNALFGSPDTGASAASYRRASELAEKAGLIFEDLDTPTQEQLLEQVKYMEDVPLEQAVQLGESKMNTLSTDPELVGKQREALARLSEIGAEGITPQEQYERELLMSNIAGADQSRQKAIAQSFAERGASNSGIEAAARLQSSQSSANAARREGQALEAEKYRRALQGISSAGNLAGQMRGQEFTEGTRKASAADNIAQFNAAQRAGTSQRNLGYKRGIAAQKAGTLEKAYGYDMDKRKSQANALTSQAQNYSNVAAKAQGKGSNMFGSIGTIGGAVAGAYFGGPSGAVGGAKAGSSLGSALDNNQSASDENCKKNIEISKEPTRELIAGLEELNQPRFNHSATLTDPIANTESISRPVEDVVGGYRQTNTKDMLDNLKAYEYDYKDPEAHGEGRQLGVMAQDLEKSKLGEQFVIDDLDGNGTKGVDYGKMAPMLLASQVEQHEETKSLKDKVKELEAMLSAFRGNK